MSATGPQPQGALLVGGVALPTAEDVFRAAAASLGDRLRAIPDGETGSRTQWIIWQLAVLEQTAGLEVVPKPPEMYGPWHRTRLEDGVAPDDLGFPELGYAYAAKQSYETFSRLKGEGEIPSQCRFQVSLPTPLAPVTVFVVPDSQALVEPPYEAAMMREVEEICASIPHDELAIQWDVCWEIAFLEGLIPPTWEGDALGGVVERMKRISDPIPERVGLGLHLCYGSYREKHFMEPTDTALMTDCANRLAAAIERPIQWIHMPVPRDRDDDGYFRPLERLELGPETQLYLGLIHHEDGAEGARRRIDAAGTAVQGFGVACECGMARKPPKRIPALLGVHREVSSPWTEG